MIRFSSLNGGVAILGITAVDAVVGVVLVVKMVDLIFFFLYSLSLLRFVGPISILKRFVLVKVCCEFETQFGTFHLDLW